jgi:hypothetical protein
MARWLLMATLAFQGLSGVAGGIGMTFDPSGQSVQIPLEWLEGSPFSSYLLPGLFLLTVLGVGPLVTIFALWKRRAWAWLASLAVGVLLLVWLGVEVAVIGYQPEPPLQLVYGVVGALILILAPSARPER